MKLFNLIKAVGGEIISEVVPGGKLIVAAVNELLPEDKRLPATATGTMVEQTLSTLPEDTRADIMLKEFDVDITDIRESHNTIRAMIEADARSPHTTRPYIAKGSFHIVAFSSVLVMLMWSYAIVLDNKPMLEAIVAGWDFTLAVNGPLVALLWAYFGVLKTEQKNRLVAATGSPPAGLASLIKALVKK